MERFGDDLVGSILRRIHDPDDRISFSLVCKQWWKVTCYSRAKLHVSVPDFVFSSLPRFPYLLSFECPKSLSSTHIEFLAQACPKLQYLKLNLKENSDYPEESHDGFASGEFDFDDDGLCAVANACSDLKEVLLRRRMNVGDVGVVSIVNLCKNLRVLDLARCISVTDEALKATGEASCVEVLNLQGCCLITDLGLGYLANGDLRKCLKKLVLAECDRISDDGMFCLKQMQCLEELNLAECGVEVTDFGASAISQIPTIERLNLSWLINVGDRTLFVLANKCLNLKEINLTGCEFITGEGLHAFKNHLSLEQLVLVSCHNFTGNDVEEILFSCPNLWYLALDRKMRMWMQMSLQNNSSEQICWIDWK